MKKKKNKPETVKPKDQEYPDRLVELESELRSYPSLNPEAVSLTSVRNPKDASSDTEKGVQFLFRDKTYRTGHSDITYADSNHARGIRHISFHAEGKMVLYIEGNFEDQQFGANFQFHNTEIYTPGDWEADFVALSDELRRYNTKRREDFRKKRIADKLRQERSHSR